MKKLLNLVAGPVAAALLCVATGSPSQAQTTAYISGRGDDLNSCTIISPCRSTGHAYGAAGNGGTITCLDAGPYTEAFDTDASYTLDCKGVVYGFIGIENGAVVTIRNVIFDGSTGGATAVRINGGKVVFDNCTFQNFTASGANAVVFTPSNAGAHLTITDSVFANNGGGGVGGAVFVQPFGGVTTSAVIERTQFMGNYASIGAYGATGTALVEVRYSTIANSVRDGIAASAEGYVASIVVEHSASLQNGGNGISALGAGAYVSLKDSTVDWNATGLSATNGGVILSYQNNMIAGNVSPGATPVSVSQQ
jgi:hypothetical protein